ncbi:hypothetical protein [Blastomonas aquatica]|uniref:DUF3077 domain-containing protein n=1 Tax=Blastomonas aquatica TaxID=1510276 RepID=A0ABQ1JIA1_9SPHN|nr:hypothetical protein [Blastomonas aquatica]GGB69126.1 hypothetical protein GCM10010833_25440 [Blastomonas aquatica]
MASNDNGPATAGAQTPTDSHGVAALLLVESLIHGLCENSTLLATEAIQIAERAASVQFDKAQVSDEIQASMWHAHALLMSIAASLQIEAQDQL